MCFLHLWLVTKLYLLKIADSKQFYYNAHCFLCMCKVSFIFNFWLFCFLQLSSWYGSSMAFGCRNEWSSSPLVTLHLYSLFVWGAHPGHSLSFKMVIWMCISFLESDCNCGSNSITYRKWLYNYWNTDLFMMKLIVSMEKTNCWKKITCSCSFFVFCSSIGSMWFVFDWNRICVGMLQFLEFWGMRRLRTLLTSMTTVV